MWCPEGKMEGWDPGGIPELLTEDEGVDLRKTKLLAES